MSGRLSPEMLKKYSSYFNNVKRCYAQERIFVEKDREGFTQLSRNTYSRGEGVATLSYFMTSITKRASPEEMNTATRAPSTWQFIDLLKQSAQPTAYPPNLLKVNGSKLPLPHSGYPYFVSLPCVECLQKAFRTPSRYRYSLAGCKQHK